MLRLAKPAIILVLVVPIVIGLLVSMLPAFAYLPALGSNEFSLRYWQALLQVPGITHSVLLSLISGLLTPLVSLLLVFLFLASANGGRFDRWVRRFLSPVLAVPHAAAAFGLAFLLAPSGFFWRLLAPLFDWSRAPDLLIINDSWGLSMMAGLVLKELPFLLLMSLAALPQLHAPDRVRMARSLGYSPAVAWLKCVAPVLYPLIRLPLFAVIAFASATVDVALILGPTLPPTLSVRLLEWFSDTDLNQRFLAGAAAMLQLGVSLAAIGLWILGEKMIGMLHRMWIHSGNRQGGEWLFRAIGRAGVSLALLIMAAGLLLIGVNSVAGLWPFPEVVPGDWTLRDWSSALPGIGQALMTTMLVAVLATALALVLVVGSLESEQHRQRRGQWWLLYIPLLIPQVVFLFGLVIFSEWLGFQPGLGLVIFGHLLFVLPYVYLSLAEAYRRLDPRWSQLAASLGASKTLAFWQIRLPLLLAPLLTATALGLAISISLYLPTQLLAAGRINTVTTEAVALASGGSASIIAVWALLQASLPVLGFAAALFVPRILWRQRQGLQEVSRQ